VLNSIAAVSSVKWSAARARVGVARGVGMLREVQPADRAVDAGHGRAGGDLSRDRGYTVRVSVFAELAQRWRRCGGRENRRVVGQRCGDREQSRSGRLHDHDVAVWSINIDGRPSVGDQPARGVCRAADGGTDRGRPGAEGGLVEPRRRGHPITIDHSDNKEKRGRRPGRNMGPSSLLVSLDRPEIAGGEAMGRAVRPATRASRQSIQQPTTSRGGAGAGIAPACLPSEPG